MVTALSALYMALVAIGNLTDYDTNDAFVRHVLAMDTINGGAPAGAMHDPDVMWRAITAPALQTAVYVSIIAWECLSAVVLLMGTVMWIRAPWTGSCSSARHWSGIGQLMVVILFFGGFIAVGGEWFQMWRSEEWNGLDAAFRNTVLALLGLLLLHLPSRDWYEVLPEQSRHDAT